MEKKNAGKTLHTGSSDARSEAARLLGSIRTERKAAASRENAKKAALTAGRPFKPLSEIECNCGGGMSLQHKATCFRGQAIKRRQQKGMPLE